ncbi:DUF4214 domain-containing protein [Cellulomonas marina]|uniref:SpoIID/LytB domain protein n=1 Tax=Cellulomonas marina TaxID=988821 RepID=A0A1I0UYC4_9CELL|nr:DUF4214 domain-containing protein [Cellulomonas marina]GIG29933.1 hypothetical protein Cma02nite_25330 [Cellulomonas marina]SFA69002.1 SpoIID/LytB domain protein [Cellulomonas marina]
MTHGDSGHHDEHDDEHDEHDDERDDEGTTVRRGVDEDGTTGTRAGTTRAGTTRAGTIRAGTIRARATGAGTTGRTGAVARAVRLLTVAAVVLGLVAVDAARGPVAPAHAEDGSLRLTVTGHGWGHGRGMGQWGALGYAQQGAPYQTILGHYYGGTRLAADAGNPWVFVELTRFTGAATDVLVQGYGLHAGSTSVPGYGYLRLRWNGSATEVQTGPSCGGPWTTASTVGATTVEVGAGGAGGLDGLIRTCEPTGSTGYRGALQLRVVGGTRYVVNAVQIDDYVRGVAAAEMPPSWGSTPNGMAALRAQTVAARSYALASSPRASGATLCDTTACQVYRGAFSTGAQGPGAARTLREDARSDQATAETSGQVMRTSAGRIARTEFSASTGGWTAGGTFPAVVDDGDAVAGNPHHTWTLATTVGEAGARLGVGVLRSFTVTGRNGLGAEGGRVTSARVVGTTATRTMTGNEVRQALGLKSDWFTVSLSPADAAALVRALYQDLLGRDAEPSGVASWSGLLIGGASSADLVGVLTSTQEYRERRVRQAYAEVLGRPADDGGLRGWVDAVAAGRLTIDDVQRLLYESPEFYLASGSDDAAYVGRVYTVMLGRAPSPEESAYWVARVRSTGRGSVGFGVWMSLEAAQGRAAGYYRTFLGREPEWSGRVHWGQVLLERGEGVVRVGIAGSDEYWARARVRFPA